MSVTTAVVLVVAILGLSVSVVSVAMVMVLTRGKVDIKKIESGQHANREMNTTASHPMFGN